MISFQPTEEQETIRQSVRDFAEQVMRPNARSCDEASAIPDSFLAQAWELGLTSTQIPESYGGYGAPRSPITNTLVLEELGCGDAALALAAVAPSQFAYAILDQGTDEQKKAYLPLFCENAYHASSLAVAEPVPDFNPFRPRTKAVPKKDVFVLSGKKCFVAMGDRATHFLVTAQNGERVDAFIIGREAAGLTVTSPEKNLGLRGLSTASLDLQNVEVPAAARLGGAAGSDVTRLLNHGRAAQAAILTGVCRGVLEFTIPYAKERVAFDEPIAQKQAIAFRFSDMRIEIEAMRNLAWRVASQLEQGADATRAAHHARIYSTEKSVWISDNGVQILGGHGFIREHPVELWYRHARTLSVMEGAATV